MRAFAVLSAFLAAIVLGPQTVSAANEKPKECRAGPVNEIYGGTPWSVYSCGDDTSLLFVAMTGSPAFPFYFVIYLKDGEYHYDGEGTGSKTATDAAYLDLRRLSQADVTLLIAMTRSVNAPATDPAAVTRPKGTFPFTKEQNLDGARFVWYAFQKANLAYDYMPADALPSSVHFRETEEPKNGYVAWWPGYVAIVSMESDKPMRFITAEAVHDAAVMEVIYGKPRFYIPMNVGPQKQ